MDTPLAIQDDRSETTRRGGGGPGDSGYLWAAASVALVLFIGYPRLATFSTTIVASDMAYLHYPLRSWMLERFAAGELPLWYPFHGLGMPFVGIAVSALFHPFTLLHVLLGPAHGLTASVVACAMLSVLGTWWLARRLGANAVGASVAGIGAGLSGPFVSTLDNITFLSGATGFPWFLGGLHLAVTAQPARKGIVVAGAALAFAVLAGDVQAAYLYGLVGLPFAVALATSSRWQAVVATAWAGALGLALAAVQAIPFVSVALTSDRARGVPWESAVIWSMHPLRLTDLFLHDLLEYAPPGAGRPLLGPLFDLGRSLPWTPTTFLGVTTGLGVLWAWTLGGGTPRQTRWLLTGMFVTLIAMALGRYGHFYGLLYTVLPGWSAFRFPEKALPFAAIAATVLAGLGVSMALQRPRHACVAALIAGGILILVSMSLEAAPDLWTDTASTLTSDSLDAAQVGELLAVHADRLTAATLRGAMVCFGAAGITLAASYSVSWRIAPILLVALQLTDLVSGNRHSIRLRSADPAEMDGPSVFVSALRSLEGKETGRYRVTSLVTAVRVVSTPAVEARGGMTQLGVVAFGRHALLPLYAGHHHIESTVPYLPGRSSRINELFRYPPRHAVAEEVPLFNARYLITDRPLFRKLGWPLDSIVAYARDVDLLLVRTPDDSFRPRAFLSWPLEVSSAEAARTALTDRATIRGHVAVVETDAPGTEVPPREDVPGIAVVRTHAPERVEIDVRLDGNRPAVLVLNDGWHPGWKATVDGEPTPILRANYLVRGVRVPPGDHRVVFRFPVSADLIVGSIISLATFVSVCACLLAPQRFRRQSGAKGPRSAAENDTD